MNARRALCALIVAWSLSGCATSTPTTGPSPPIVGVLKDCGLPVVRDLAQHLLDDVASALVVSGTDANGWHAALLAIAARAGADGLSAVTCAVQELLAQAQAQLTARSRMDAATAAQLDLTVTRCQAWLAEVRK